MTTHYELHQIHASHASEGILRETVNITEKQVELNKYETYNVKNVKEMFLIDVHDLSCSAGKLLEK